MCGHTHTPKSAPLPPCPGGVSSGPDRAIAPAPYAGLVDKFAAATKRFEVDDVDWIGARGLAPHVCGLYAAARQHARRLQGRLVLRPMAMP